MRILIVDDQPDSAELLGGVATRAGHEVALANSSEDALEIARTFKPEVAFLDVMIRCESGYLLARDLRELPGVAKCQFVAVTGFIQQKHRDASHEAGFLRHLVKPLETKMVLEAIEAASPAGAL